jgi:hypothetical protein
MSTRFYQAPDLNIERMGYDLEGILAAQGYHTQHFGDRERFTIQLKKGSDFEAFLGLQAALTIVLQYVPGGVAAMLGEQQWIDKAAVGLAGFLLFPPLILTAGAGALRQASMENELFNALDTVALRQHANVHIGAVPPNIEAQMYQQHAAHAPHAQPAYGPPPQGPQTPFYQPPTAPQPAQNPARPAPGNGPIPMPPQGQKLCPHCQTAYDPEDAFCSHCGKPLKPTVKHCANCEAELKPNAEFCAKCGTPTR